MVQLCQDGNREKWKGLLATFFLALLPVCLFVMMPKRGNISVNVRPVHKPVKRMIFWTQWYHRRFPLERVGEVHLACPFACTLHSDRGNSLLYDAILFHTRDLQHPPRERSPDQVYIVLFKESPRYPGRQPYIHGNFYNMSATYNPRSDIWIPYLSIHTKKETGFPPNFLPASLPQMTYKQNASEAMIAWVVSHCRTKSRREQYVQTLQRYTKVDIFGKCGKPCPKNEKGSLCHKALAESGKYKFYLSFENSSCQSYITEKVYNPLAYGMVPIVYGGLKHKDYASFLPSHSFIDVRDFQSAKKLSEYLLYLNRNNTAYLEYHMWRSEYSVTMWTYNEYLCQVCKHLHNNTLKQPKTIDFGKEWDVKKNCDLHLLDKVRGQ